MSDLEERPNRDHETLRRIEVLISRLLFWGALLSIVIAAAGFVIYVANGSLEAGGLKIQDQLRSQRAHEPLVFVSVPEIGKSLKNANPLAITALGLLLLLLIPVVTVALLIFAFFRERDYRYSAVAAIVLIILFISLLFGGAA